VSFVPEISVNRSYNADESRLSSLLTLIAANAFDLIEIQKNLSRN